MKQRHKHELVEDEPDDFNNLVVVLTMFGKVYLLCVVDFIHISEIFKPFLFLCNLLENTVKYTSDKLLLELDFGQATFAVGKRPLIHYKHT